MWYAVSLLFRSVHNGRPDEDDLWEESIVLIMAANEDLARQKSEQLGREAEHEYESVTHDQVRWTFQQIERICLIESEHVGDGTELFSRFLRSSEVESLLTPFRDTVRS